MPPQLVPERGEPLSHCLEDGHHTACIVGIVDASTGEVVQPQRHLEEDGCEISHTRHTRHIERQRLRLARHAKIDEALKKDGYRLLLAAVEGVAHSGAPDA